MKFKRKITLTISGDSRNPNSLTMHFIIFLKNVVSVFIDDFKNDNVTIEITDEDVV